MLDGLLLHDLLLMLLGRSLLQTLLPRLFVEGRGGGGNDLVLVEGL